ncbi:hypothetical protein K2Z84_08105 [Candidatus Binatia bacterium]|nr:hypothetical protein [Candidatus Binatia bacterium]
MKYARFTSALIAFALLAATVPPVLAQDAAPMDNAAIAASYDQEAKDAQAKAASHELMLSRYKNMPMLPKGSSVNKEQMVKHCQSLVDSYKATAKQAADLAKAHREMATAK